MTRLHSLFSLTQAIALSFLSHPFCVALSSFPHSSFCIALRAQTFLLIRTDIGRQPPPVQALCKGTSTPSSASILISSWPCTLHSPGLDWTVLPLHLHTPYTQDTSADDLLSHLRLPRSFTTTFTSHHPFDLELLSVQQALNDITVLLILYYLLRIQTLFIIGRRNKTNQYGEGRESEVDLTSQY